MIQLRNRTAAEDVQLLDKMPQDPLFPEPDDPTRPRSPEAASSNERKRRRKVLSCYDCRRRKLQCDRGMPACGRCTKAGQAANCLYIDDATDLPVRHADQAAMANAEFSAGPFEGHYTRPMQASGPSNETLSRLEYQDRRIKQLESALAQSVSPSGVPAVQQLKHSRLPLTPESPATIEPTVAPINTIDRETMLLRGKSFKTQFHGITHPGSLISYIPELSAFTKETFQRIPGLLRIREEMKALEVRTTYAHGKVSAASELDLYNLLPPRTEANQLIELYLDNFDSLYHIIHLPTFRRDYDLMWATPMSQIDGRVVALSLLMMATAQCLQNSEPWLYTANSSTARENAITAICTCERWLEVQSQKHVQCMDFQIRFLLNLAKLVNALKFKRIWTDAGAMIRFFMAAGLHRNPDLLRKQTSALDKEMRRRLWAAASEFELQVAFSRGMISAPFPQQSDCPPPTNIHDDDLVSDADSGAPARPINEFTNSSCMVLANETFNLRYTLNVVLNNIRQTVSFDDAKRYTEEIEAHLASIPMWIGSSAEAPRALLSITLRQYILVLHDRQFRQAKSQGERDFAKMTLLSAAGKIIDTHKALVSRGCRGLQLLSQEQIRAALSVCHIATTPDPGADTILTDLVEERAAAIISNVADHLADKITRYGREQRQLWIVLAADALMKSKKNPDQKLTYMQEAVDKITRPYYRIMAGQEDVPTKVASTDTSEQAKKRRLEMPNGIIEYMPNTGAEDRLQELASAAADPALLDFEGLAEWTFDDWAFNPMDFENFVGTLQ